jgi:hypothetical protein
MPIGSLEMKRPVTGSYQRIIPLRPSAAVVIPTGSAGPDQVAAVSEEVTGGGAERVRECGAGKTRRLTADSGHVSNAITGPLYQNGQTGSRILFAVRLRPAAGLRRDLRCAPRMERTTDPSRGGDICGGLPSDR